MRKIIQTTYRLMLVSVLLLALVLPCYAMSQPVVTPVADMQELLALYDRDATSESLREYFSELPMVCTGETVLGTTVGRVDLIAIEGLHVAPDAVLTLDNPNLVVMGPPPVITVEPGGTLRILRWNPMMVNGDMLVEGGIRVEAGGVLELADGLKLPDKMVVQAQAPPNTIEPPETTLPSTPEPEPEPEPEPPPEPQPITNLWGEVRKVGNGKLNYAMTLPRLEMEDVDAIAIERSADGVHWTTEETFLWDQGLGYFTTGPDSFSAIQFGEDNTYIAYVEETDYQDFYLRLTLEGTSYAGMTNMVKVTIPADAGPGVSVKPPTTGDYEDNEGNQGGGGQGESDRTGQQAPEPTPEPTPSEAPTPTPTPMKAPPENHIPEEETPDNHLPVIAESEESPADLPQSDTGTGNSSVSFLRPVGNNGHRAEPVPLPAQPPVETDAPRAEAEETPTQEPIKATEQETVTTVAEEPPAMDQESEPAVQQDGDRGGQAALMTLALGGGVAAVGAITVRIKSHKRRP